MSETTDRITDDTNPDQSKILVRDNITINADTPILENGNPSGKWTGSGEVDLVDLNIGVQPFSFEYWVSTSESIESLFEVPKGPYLDLSTTATTSARDIEEIAICELDSFESPTTGKTVLKLEFTIYTDIDPAGNNNNPFTFIYLVYATNFSNEDLF